MPIDSIPLAYKLILFIEGMLWCLIIEHVIPMIWKDLKGYWKVMKKKSSTEQPVEQFKKISCGLIISNSGAKRKG